MTLQPVVSAFGRRLSLKQLDDGAYLIGGGWPAHVTDEAANAWELQDDERARQSRGRPRGLPAGGRTASWRGAGRGSRRSCRTTCRCSGRCRACPGSLVAAGFSGHGFALSPIVGDILARLALGHDARADLWRGLRLDRFAPASVAAS